MAPRDVGSGAPMCRHAAAIEKAAQRKSVQAGANAGDPADARRDRSNPRRRVFGDARPAKSSATWNDECVEAKARSGDGIRAHDDSSAGREARLPESDQHDLVRRRVEVEGVERIRSERIRWPDDVEGLNAVECEKADLSCHGSHGTENARWPP